MTKKSKNKYITLNVMYTAFSKFGYNMELETNEKKKKGINCTRVCIKIGTSRCRCEEELIISAIVLSAKRRKESLTSKIILLQLRDLRD